MSNLLRGIVEEEYGGKKTFRNDLMAVEPDPKKADELIEGATWVLSRDPKRGVRVTPYSDSWYFEILKPHRCILYYAFDDKEVLLISIQRR
jgi:hypothetical protein